MAIKLMLAIVFQAQKSTGNISYFNTFLIFSDCILKNNLTKSILHNNDEKKS